MFIKLMIWKGSDAQWLAYTSLHSRSRLFFDSGMEMYGYTSGMTSLSTTYGYRPRLLRFRPLSLDLKSFRSYHR